MSRPLLVPAQHWERLCENGKRTASGEDLDPPPVIKLFTPDAQAAWLLSEVDSSDPDRAFGLCDLGVGFPELGYVSLTELTAVRGRLGLSVEVDGSFIATAPLSAYADAARRAGWIVAPLSADLPVPSCGG